MPADGYRPLLVTVVAMVVGITIDRWVCPPLAVSWLAAVVAISAWLWYWRRSTRFAHVASLLIAVGAASAAWHHLVWHLQPADDVGRFARPHAAPICLEAVALAAPRQQPKPPYDPLRAMATPDRSRLTIHVRAIRDGADWRDADGRATLLVDGHLLGIHAGDRLRIVGKIAKMTPALNPGEFDFSEHARGDGLSAVVRAGFPDCVALQQRGAVWRPQRWLDELRRHGNRMLQTHLSPKQAPLASAVLLGVREEIQRDQRQALIETGTVHLLAISGLHVGILALGLFGLLRLGLVRRAPALLAVAAVTLLYALVTDARPPVIRATVLVWVICLAMWAGRRATSLNTLAAAAIVVLVFNPADLFRVGTQLSFLAVAAIGWRQQRRAARAEADPLDRLIARTRPWPIRISRKFGGWCWQILALSTVVWLATTPLVSSRFHVLSLTAAPLTLLLWIPITTAMLSGFALLVFGTILPPLASPLAAVCDASLSLVQRGVELGHSVPGGHHYVPGPDGWWLCGLYGVLAVFVLVPSWRPPRRWCAGLLCGWIVVGVAVAWGSSRSDDRLDCTFVSVGHGTSVLLELPDGQTVLYDAGRLGTPSGGGRQISSVLWSRGITHLDAVVLSHADVDHYNALPMLLDRFSVSVVYVSPQMFLDESPALRALRDSIQRAGVPLREVWQGDRLRLAEECKIEVLHPPQHGVIGGATRGGIFNDNANSIVLAIEYQGRRILLPGDLESPGLESVTAEQPWDCDILMAPHHGSLRSDPPGFAAWCRPEWVVVSGGHGRDMTAAAIYEAQGGEVLHTAIDGAVRFRITAGEIEVSHFHENNADDPH